MLQVMKRVDGGTVAVWHAEREQIAQEAEMAAEQALSELFAESFEEVERHVERHS